jgi:proteic killer suppression protein
MIKSWKHKELRRLFETGHSKISRGHHAKSLRMLDTLDASVVAQDMNLPGYDFHGLRGKPKRYSVHVNGNFCITFEFENGDALHVDYEDYH